MRVIMLSPDALQPLDGVYDGDVLIVGGLCDAKRIIGASLGRAKELGIEVRRLPLQEWGARLSEQFTVRRNALDSRGNEQQHDRMPKDATKVSTKKPTFVDILTVDQVFAILVALANNGNDWFDALSNCLPMRKIGK